MAVIPQPPYSPDLAPCDFFLFPKMKLNLKGRRFETIEAIQAESQSAWNSDRKILPGSYTDWAIPAQKYRLYVCIYVGRVAQSL
jgi:hypothetical protein